MMSFVYLQNLKRYYKTYSCFALLILALQDKLKRTVAHRQKMCMEKSTSEILAAFPTYHQHLYVSAEMFSITFITNI